MGNSLKTNNDDDQWRIQGGAIRPCPPPPLEAMAGLAIVIL